MVFEQLLFVSSIVGLTSDLGSSLPVRMIALTIYKSSN